MTEPVSRLAPPNPGAYETSPGEQAVLRGLDLRNLGGMYGILLGQRGDANERMADYSNQLNYTNTQQAAITRAQLEEAGRQHDGTIALGLAREGLGLPEALQASQLASLRVNQDPATAARNILSAEELRRAARRASTLKDSGQGLEHLANAGAYMNPGQRFDAPEGAANARMTVGEPLRLRQEAMQQAGANARDSNTGGKPVKFTVNADPLSQIPKLKVENASLGATVHYTQLFDKHVQSGDYAAGKPFNPPPFVEGSPAAAPAPTGGKASPLEGPLPGVSPETQRLLDAGNMGSARGARPPPPSATPPASPARAAPPSGGTPPPDIVNKGRAVAGSTGVRWIDGSWYAMVGGKPVRIQ